MPHEERMKQLLNAKEDEHLEFKEAKSSFEFEKLVKYCAALSNEGGGKMVLGVTDNIPRKVVGTQAFTPIERTKSGLIGQLRIRIDVDEINHPDGRVLIFNVPSRPIGVPIQYKGAFWMRGGEDIIPMTQDMLRKIFDEVGPDFTAEVCERATIDDLDPAGIQKFRTMWHRKSGNSALESISNEQLLSDAELLVDGGITYAALILLGTRPALGRYLPQAEVIFEYRSSEVSGPAQQREEYREGLLLFEDKLLQVINNRNDTQHFQDGLYVWDIKTFNETVIREAILNSVSHRYYRLAGSIFIRQFPRKMEIVSPGGFPPGITLENILWRQAPRNRRVAEALGKCGLVERSGQGINLMFEECIKESKPKPDFNGTDAYQVFVTLRGDVQDPQFLRFLEKIGRERQSSFTTEDLLVLDLINKEKPVPDNLRSRLPYLQDSGAIEIVGRRRYILSRSFYGFIGKKGVYTRKRGLDRETNKELLLRHIKDNKKDGSRMRELLQVLPSHTRARVKALLRELTSEDKISCIGHTSAGRWYPRNGG